MKSKLLLLIALIALSEHAGFSIRPTLAWASSSFVQKRSKRNKREPPVDQDLTPLMVAVRDQEVEVVMELLRSNPNLAARDQEGWAALTYAALNQDTTIIKALIDQGADLDSKDNLGMTPLMHTATSGKNAVAQLLVNAGADVNAQDDLGQTALTFAEHRKASDLIKILRAAGGLNPLQEIIRTDDLPPDDPPGFTRPVILNLPRPNYTEKARHNRVQGIIRLRILIGKDGSVLKMRAITGLPDGLTREAYRTANQLEFIPATRDGQPVDFWLIIETEFNVR
jgi:TonB family protein